MILTEWGLNMLNVFELDFLMITILILILLLGLSIYAVILESRFYNDNKEKRLKRDLKRLLK